MKDTQPTNLPNSGQDGTSVAVNFTFLVIYLAGLSAFGSFVNDMYLPSLPSMKKFFGCSVSAVQLGLTMGMAGLGIGQLLLGPFSDKYGRKPVLVISILVFCAAAATCLFSRTIEFFLWCRFVQGLGASGGYFLARTIPADFYKGRQLAKTMAVVGAINGIAPASSPVIGGFISSVFDWKGVFVALIIFAVILLCFASGLKESLPPEKRVQGSVWSAFSGYRTLLNNKKFMIHVVLKGACLGLMFSYISSAPFIMQTHFGFSETVFGCIMGGNALFVAIGAMVALKFKVLKTGAFVGGWCLMVSSVIEAVTMFLVDSFWTYELLMLPLLISAGIIFTVGNTLAMNEGRADAGNASAILGITGYIFGAVVAPLVGKGDIMHSTAIAFLILASVTLVFAYLTKRLPADLDQ